jgi:hypothetical protein
MSACQFQFSVHTELIEFRWISLDAAVYRENGNSFKPDSIMTFASALGKWNDEAVYIHTQSHNTEDQVSLGSDSHSGRVSIEFPADYSSGVL